MFPTFSVNTITVIRPEPKMLFKNFRFLGLKNLFGSGSARVVLIRILDTRKYSGVNSRHLYSFLFICLFCFALKKSEAVLKTLIGPGSGRVELQ